MLTKEDLKVGACYRAKKPRAAGWPPDVNDRQILHIGLETVQYDSPSISHGRHYPKTTIEKFLKWAGSIVELPERGWESWENYQASKGKKT